MYPFSLISIFRAVLLSLVTVSLGTTTLQAKETHSWPEIRQLILQKNPSWESFKLKEESLKGAVIEAEFRPRPVLSLELENIIGTGEWSAMKGVEIVGSYTKVLERPEKRKGRIGAILSQKEVLDAQRKNEQSKVLALAFNAYIDVLFAKETVTLGKEEVAQAQALFQMVSEKFQAGKIPQIEKVRAEIELIQTKAQLDKKLKDLEAKQLYLYLFWQSESTENQTEINGELRQKWNWPEEKRLKNILLNHPAVLDVQAQQKELKARGTLDLANLKWDWEVFGGLKQDAGSGDLSLQAGFSRPIKSNALGNGLTQQLMKENEVLENIKNLRILEIKKELKVLLLELKNAQKTLNFLRETVLPMARQTVLTFQEGYQAGKFSLIEVLDAQRSLIDLRHQELDGIHQLQIIQGKQREILALDLFEVTNGVKP